MSRDHDPLMAGGNGAIVSTCTLGFSHPYSPGVCGMPISRCCGPCLYFHVHCDSTYVGDNRRSVDNRFDVYASPEVSSREQSRSVPAIPFLDVHAHAPTITLLDADADVAEGLDPEELECTADTGRKFEQTPSAQSFSSPCPTPPADVAEGLDPEELGECTADTGPKFEQTPSAQSFSSPCPTRHMAEPGHLNRRSPPPPPRLSRVSNMCNLNWDMVPVLDQDGLLDPGGPEAQMTAPTQEFLVAWRTRTEAQLQVSVA